MRHRDFIQNITITLLTLSAVFLFSRTQFFQLGAAAGSGYWQHLTAPIGSGETDTALSDRLLAPVRLAVSGEYGRYGSVSLTTGGEEFTPVKTLLREVIGSARSLSIPLGPSSAPRWKPPPFTAIFSPPCLWSIYRTSWGRKRTFL